MAFSIEVRFLGGLTLGQQDAFASAAARWAEVITGDLPRVRLGNLIIDNIIITAQGVRIDGPGRVLGRAAPHTFCLRPGSFCPPVVSCNLIPRIWLAWK